MKVDERHRSHRDAVMTLPRVLLPVLVPALTKGLPAALIAVLILVGCLTVSDPRAGLMSSTDADDQAGSDSVRVAAGAVEFERGAPSERIATTAPT